MAVKTKKKNVKTSVKALPSPFNIYWARTNYLLFGLGMLLIIFGFYFMSLGEWDSASSLLVSPILLFIGFVIVMPASILYRKKEVAESEVVKTEN
ncbi:MAG TPA: hypothetical protein VF870_06230 [Ignavibacteriaceae bacterium]